MLEASIGPLLLLQINVALIKSLSHHHSQFQLK